MKRHEHLWHLAELFLEWEMFQRQVGRYMLYVQQFYFFPEIRAVYEMMWKGMVKMDRL